MRVAMAVLNCWRFSSTYRNAVVVSVSVDGVTRSTINARARMLDIKLKRAPARSPLLVKGKIIFRKRRPHVAPATMAASSSSSPNYIIAETPAREVKGSLLIEEASTIRKNVP